MSINVVNQSSAFVEDVETGEISREQMIVDGQPVVSHEDEWGVVGKNTVSSRYYQVYRVVGPWCADDEMIYYSCPIDEDKLTTVEIKDADENTYNEKYKNIYGAGNAIAYLTFTPNEEMVTKYGKGAIVAIDGKEWDINVLNSEIKLTMTSCCHRITIKWSADIMEAFRIVKSSPIVKEEEEETEAGNEETPETPETPEAGNEETPETPAEPQD